jgi:predicted transposase YdaD
MPNPQIIIMSNIVNPHDKFFRESFSRLEVVQNFIEEVFPDNIQKKINLDSLQLINASFTDSLLSEYIADIVYQTELNGSPALITLLFEHKSYIDAFPHWQLLRYMTNIWYEEQKQQKQCSVIIPIIIYHGESRWNKISLKNYFMTIDNDLEAFLPEFDYLLFSLNSFSDKQITSFRSTFLSVATIILKYSRAKKEVFLQMESFLVEGFKILEQQHEYEYLTSIIIYLETTTDLTINELITIFTKVSPKIKQVAMTTVDQIREHSAIESIKRAINNGINNVELLATILGLSAQKVEDVIRQIKTESK